MKRKKQIEKQLTAVKDSINRDYTEYKKGYQECLNWVLDNDK